MVLFFSFYVYEKIKKNVVGPVVIVLLFGGENEKENSDSDVNDAEYF